MWKKIKYIVCSVLLLVFLLSIGYITYAKNATSLPALFGFSVVRVQTESMEPTLDLGDIVIIKHTDPQKLEVSDIIAYRGTEYPVRDTLVTNQIVEIRQDKSDYYFTTRGCKADSLNDPEIEYSNVFGKVLYKIPFLGTLYDFFSTPYGIIAFIAVLLMAFSSEIMSLFRMIRINWKYEDPEIPKNAQIPEFDSRFNSVLTQEVDELLKDLDDDNS